MVRGHVGDVAGRPGVDVAVSPDAGHAVFGELGHIPVGEHGQLAVDDRVPEGVLRGLAAVDVEEGHGLVEVVHDGRMPLEIPAEKILVGLARVVNVAVVVVHDVLAPVGDAGHFVVVGDVDVVGEVPVDGAVAAIGIGDGHDGDDDVLANFLDQGRVFGGEAIGQLHQHFRRAELGAVEASGERIDRLGIGDEVGGLGVGEAARIGKAGEVLPLLIEVSDGVLRADEDDDRVAAFFGLADADDFDARGMRGESVVIAEDIGVIGEFFGRADVVAEDIFGRRHCGAEGEMVDERAHELRLGGPLFDLCGVVGIHGLGRWLRCGCLGGGGDGQGSEERGSEEYEQERSGTPEHGARSPMLRISHSN